MSEEQFSIPHELSHRPVGDKSDFIGGLRTGLFVIPAYEETKRLPAFAESLKQIGFLDRPGWRTCVVDDGSRPESQVALLQAMQRRGLVEGRDFLWRPLTNNRGKGGAVYAGWNEFCWQTEWLAFVDADGAVPAEEVVRLVTRAEATPGVAWFASRVKMLGREVERSWRRHIYGRLFATLVGTFVHPGIYDSQCGLKIVPAPFYREARARLVERRFAFDVELLAALVQAGVPIEEVPINWRDVPGSKVHLVRDSWRMIRAILGIRARLKEGTL